MNIAIVGAGEGGKNMLETLKENNLVNIQAICDRDLNAEGMQLAKQMNIDCIQDFKELKHYNLDIVIEITGIDKVKNALEEFYRDEKVAVIGSKSAKFVSIVIDEAVMMSKTLDNQLKTIQQTVNRFEKEFEKIVVSVDTLTKVERDLKSSVNTSQKFINQSDELIMSINKIAQKNKILGLNANIEAARAGEAGKGFSVVAKEMQELSDTTNTFAEQVSEALNLLRQEITDIGSEIGKLYDLSENQSELSQDLDKILNEFTENI